MVVIYVQMLLTIYHEYLTTQQTRWLSLTSTPNIVYSVSILLIVVNIWFFLIYFRLMLSLMFFFCVYSPRCKFASLTEEKRGRNLLV